MSTSTPISGSTPLRDLIPSIVRTVVPILVSQIVALLGMLGVILPEDASAQVANLVGLMVGSLFYVLVRIIETKYPKIGLLLLFIKVPVYVDPTKTVDEQRPELRASVQAAAKTDNVGLDEAGRVSSNLVWTIVVIAAVVVLAMLLL